MDLPPEITWNEEIKKRISGAVAEEVGRIRICQKVFPTRRFASTPLDVPNDAFDLSDITQIPEGLTSDSWNSISSLKLLLHKRETSPRA